MVLPLLGILGLGAAAAAKPHYDNYAARTRGAYGSEVIDGIDPNNPAATRNALFGGGLLDPQQFQADSRTQFEGMAQRAQSDANSRRAAATSRANSLTAAETARARLRFEENQIAFARE